MGDSWREVPVDAIKASSDNALATGPFGSSIGSKYFQDSGVPVIRGSNLSTDIGSRLDDNGLVFISPEKAKQHRRSMVQQGDLVFTCWGTVNQVGLVDSRASYQEYIISNKQMKLTPDPKLADSLFLYYLFSGPEIQHRILSEAIGSSVPGFNLGQLREILLRLPPLSAQRAIAHILGTLDDKIELNRLLSETLEAMARAIFRSWFVDFLPVRAKAEGRDTGLPRHIADLFPDRLVDSEMGEVPEGWKVSSLGGHFKATKGVSYKGSGLCEDGTPLHNLNSVYEGGGYKHEGIKYYSGEFKKRHQVVPGDVIVANTEQGHDRLLIGYAAQVPNRFAETSICSHHIFKMQAKPDSPMTNEYLCYLLNSRAMHDTVSGYANGTTVNMLPLDALVFPKIVIPPVHLVARFSEIASATQGMDDLSITQSSTLSELRDTLLPKLLSGEIRVKDAEKFLKDAS